MLIINIRFKITFIILLCFYLSLITTKIFSVTYTNTYFFGDSLTDNGNFNDDVFGWKVQLAPIVNNNAPLWGQSVSDFYSTNFTPREYNINQSVMLNIYKGLWTDNPANPFANPLHPLYGPWAGVRNYFRAHEPALSPYIGQTNYAIVGSNTSNTKGQIIEYLFDKNITTQIEIAELKRIANITNAVNREAAEATFKDALINRIITSQNRLNPNELYLLWIGANDVVHTSAGARSYRQSAANARNPLARHPIFGQIIGIPDPLAVALFDHIAELSTFTTDKTAQNIVDSVTLLRLAGAHNVVVLNLPDLTKVPRGIASYNHRADPDPFKHDISNASDAVVINQSLLNKIKSLSFSVLLIDLDRIFQEITIDPNSFGFTDVSHSGHYGGTAATGYNPEDFIDAVLAPVGYLGDTFTIPGRVGNFIGSENHTGRLFYDGFHPTAAAHKILGDSIQSILTAPHTIITMAETTRSVSQTINSTLLNQLQLPNNTDKKVLPFFNIQTGSNRTPNIERTDSYSDPSSLTVGFKSYLSNSLNLGFAFSSHRNPTQTKITAPTFNASGSFNLHGYTASLFMNNNYAVLNTNFIFQIGNLYYDDISRSFYRGTKYTKAIGNTHGYYTSSILQVGMNYLNKYSNLINIGPFVEFNYNRLSIDEYKETNARSVNVAFHNQHFEDLIGGLGFQCLLNLANTSKGHFNINTSLSWHQRLLDISTPIEFHHAPDRYQNNIPVPDNHLIGTKGQFPIKPANNIAFFKGNINLAYTLKNKLTTTVGYYLVNGEGNMFNHNISSSIKIPIA